MDYIPGWGCKILFESLFEWRCIQNIVGELGSHVLGPDKNRMA